MSTSFSKSGLISTSQSRENEVSIIEWLLENRDSVPYSFEVRRTPIGTTAQIRAVKLSFGPMDYATYQKWSSDLTTRFRNFSERFDVLLFSEHFNRLSPNSAIFEVHGEITLGKSDSSGLALPA